MTQVSLTVTIENLAPTQGTNLTPVWVGFHDGGFDIYNPGESLVGFPGTEELAEDGNNEPITEQFDLVGAGSVQGTVGGAPIAPGDTVEQTFVVDSADPDSRYFSYASMILPSNDAFVANANPLAFEIFSETGEFLGTDFIVLGEQVNDAATEINDEIPENTAFFGQQEPQTGVDETAPVVLHPGFIPDGPILTAFPGADFTQPDFEVARVTVAEIGSDGNLSTVEVTVENLAPEQGTNLTPVWVGFHDGGFDLYNPGEALVEFPGTEELAEDGDAGPISTQFDAIAAGTVQGVVGGGPIAPEDTVTQTFTIDRSLDSSRYFSYLAMILPSNDAFVANADPLTFEIVDADGNFVGTDFTVLGSQVNDAATEINDEIPENTAFFGQQEPQTGVVETAPVVLHPGFIPDGPILTAFPGADFTEPGYEVARITVTAAETVEIDRDAVIGTPEADTIFAGVETDASADLILTGAGPDEIDLALDTSATGENLVLAGSDGDTIALSIGDIVSGGSGEDTIVAFESQGGNRASGGTGDDTFLLGDTDGLQDRFFGGAGSDRFIVGLGGGNLLAGGTDVDTFTIVSGDNPSSANTITDFEIGSDVLEIAASAFGTADLDLSDGSNVILGGDVIAVLSGVEAASLSIGTDILFTASPT